VDLQSGILEITLFLRRIISGELESMGAIELERDGIEGDGRCAYAACAGEQE
jgi:hypothetical protein